MNAVAESRYFPAAQSKIATLLLRPLDLPAWNPAFLSIDGGSEAVVGQPHPITVTGGLRGTFQYTQITPDIIAMDWHAPGLREYCDWTLVAQGAGTLVTHSITRTGPLSMPLRRALAGLPGLRFERLAQQLRR